jgi:hypothetical protein
MLGVFRGPNADPPGAKDVSGGLVGESNPVAQIGLAIATTLRMPHRPLQRPHSRGWSKPTTHTRPASCRPVAASNVQLACSRPQPAQRIQPLQPKRLVSLGRWGLLLGWPVSQPTGAHNRCNRHTGRCLGHGGLNGRASFAPPELEISISGLGIALPPHTRPYPKVRFAGYRQRSWIASRRGDAVCDG